MVPFLRQGATRIGGSGSVLQRTQAAVTSPAVAGDRRLLVPRRMLCTEKEQSKDLKLPHQVMWELIKIFPAGKVFNLVAVSTVAVMIASTGREVKEASEGGREEAEQVNVAEKKREQ